MVSSAVALGGLLRAAGVEDEEESTAPSSAVRVSLPSREGGSPAVESAPRTPPGDPLSSPWRSSLFSPRDVSLSAVRRVVDGSSQTQDSFYDTPDSGSVSDESFVQQYVQQPSWSAFGDSEVELAGNRNGTRGGPPGDYRRSGSVSFPDRTTVVSSPAGAASPSPSTPGQSRRRGGGQVGPRSTSQALPRSSVERGSQADAPLPRLEMSSRRMLTPTAGDTMSRLGSPPTPPTVMKMPARDDVGAYDSSLSPWRELKATAQGMVMGASISKDYVALSDVHRRVSAAALQSVLEVKGISTGALTLSNPITVMAARSRVPGVKLLERGEEDTYFPLSMFSLDIFRETGWAVCKDQRSGDVLFGGAMRLELLHLGVPELYYEPVVAAERPPTIVEELAGHGEQALARIRSQLMTSSGVHQTAHAVPAQSSSKPVAAPGVSARSSSMPTASTAPTIADDITEATSEFDDASRVSATLSSGSKQGGRGKPLQFNKNLLDVYDGSCTVLKAPGTSYTSNPGSWLKRAHLILTNAQTAPGDLASCACMYLSERLRHKLDVYQAEWGVGEGSAWSRNAAPGKHRSMPWADFCEWLLSVSYNHELREEARDALEEAVQEPAESTHDFVARWQFLRLQLDTYLEMEGLPAVDYGEQLQKERFVAKLRFDIEQALMRDLLSSHRQSVMRAHVGPSNLPLMVMRATTGMWNSVTIDQLQNMACSVALTATNVSTHRRRQAARARGHEGAAASTPWRRRQSQLRHATASVAGEGSDGDPGGTAELYQKLVRAGRVKWSPAQLNRLREEQRCFFCGEKGHQKSECTAVTPADPGNFRFLHNLEVVQLDDSESLDSDDEMRELLLDFDQSKNGASSRR